MSPLLTAGVYGTSSHTTEGPFDLRVDQMRPWPIIRNAGWYNAAGQRLGWGDIDAGDMERIIRTIEPGEIFILLTETDAYWRFYHEQRETLGLFPSDPGMPYVRNHAQWSLGHNLIARIVEDDEDWVVPPAFPESLRPHLGRKPRTLLGQMMAQYAAQYQQTSQA